MFASARMAATLILDPAFSRVVIKSVALTLLLFAGLFGLSLYGANHLLGTYAIGSGISTSLLAALFVIVLVTILGAPVAALFAGLFLDEIAAAVEAKHYPADLPGKPAPFWQGFFLGIRLFVVLVSIMLLLLPLSALAPGLGSLPGIVVSGWFLGREYFEQVAVRHASRSSADALRRRKRGAILGCGLLIAALAAVPVLDLLAPLFGTALMVHEFKRYTRKEMA
ncbi:MAG: EI24 domain-containing protein [Alphaproteobacteria bacterium]|nr:EI24 domain-containing protein [Alphaproteobacteria bacterium]MBV9062647.1 EI24 domain-containing protein [Alphaproteobacteria bacterium]